MAWQQKLANKMLLKYVYPIVNKPKFAGIENKLSYKEQQKFINFAEKFVTIVLSIATYMSYFLVLTYIKNKWGLETAGLLVAVMIVGKLTNIGEGLQEK